MRSCSRIIRCVAPDRTPCGATITSPCKGLPMKRTLLACCLLLSTALTNPASALPISNLFILGDSLSEQGNLFAATSAQYPVTIPPIPAADHYNQGRFSNGEIYAGLLANKLGLSSSPTSVGGNNYAYGGARTTYIRVEASAPFNLGGILPSGARPWTLDLEREAFAAQGIHDPNALYVIWSGSNDVGDIIPLVLTGNTVLAAQFMSTAVTGIKDGIDTFLNAGAQTILVPNVPDLGLVPEITAKDPLFPGAPPHLASQTATAVVQQFNSLVDAMLRGYSGVDIVRYDSIGYLRVVVADTAAFWVSNVTLACFSGFVSPAGPIDTVCANPDDFVFWDAEHPSAAFHAVIADQFFAAVVPEPSSVLLCSAGSLACG